MDGLYYLGMLIGVVWLCLWAVFPKLTSRYPSPFDMLNDTEKHDTSDPGWRRQGDQPEADPAPADLQHPVSEPRTAQSWRVRREQAQASGRKRGG
jgi:hypothetical protein